MRCGECPSPVSVQPPAGANAVGRRPAFTIVELAIVITLVVIVLALAVPSLSAMNAEARLTSATQTISATLRRAYFLAVGDVNMSAVRFLPAEWSAQSEGGNAVNADRQHMMIYRYAGKTYDPQAPDADVVNYQEYFEPREGVEPVALPEGVWVAPLEALENGINGQRWLTGTFGEFAVDAEAAGAGGFVDADDFLIVIDPHTGVRMGAPQAFPLRSYAPHVGYEIHANPGDGKPFQRYSFSGVVVYRRDALVSVGANPAERQAFLQDEGRAFMVHRYSGGLMEGLGRPE